MKNTISIVETYLVILFLSMSLPADAGMGKNQVPTNKSTLEQSVDSKVKKAKGYIHPGIPTKEMSSSKPRLKTKKTRKTKKEKKEARKRKILAIVSFVSGIIGVTLTAIAVATSIIGSGAGVGIPGFALFGGLFALGALILGIKLLRRKNNSEEKTKKKFAILSIILGGIVATFWVVIGLWLLTWLILIFF